MYGRILQNVFVIGICKLDIRSARFRILSRRNTLRQGICRSQLNVSRVIRDRCFSKDKFLCGCVVALIYLQIGVLGNCSRIYVKYDV